MKPNISLKKLRELLNYNPKTGVFIWRVNKSQRVRAGMEAGTRHQGYIRIIINRKAYLAHRLAWFYTYGYFPDELDHRDLNRSNNKINNLRECTGSQNRCNRYVYCNNILGIKGIRYKEKKGLYEARISINGKTIHIGSSKCLEKAKEIYAKALPMYHKEFARIS